MRSVDCHDDLLLTVQSQTHPFPTSARLGISLLSSLAVAERMHQHESPPSLNNIRVIHTLTHPHTQCATYSEGRSLHHLQQPCSHLHPFPSAFTRKCAEWFWPAHIFTHLAMTHPTMPHTFYTPAYTQRAFRPPKWKKHSSLTEAFVCPHRRQTGTAAQMHPQK